HLRGAAHGRDADTGGGEIRHPAARDPCRRAAAAVVFAGVVLPLNVDPIVGSRSTDVAAGDGGGPRFGSRRRAGYSARAAGGGATHRAAAREYGEESLDVRAGPSTADRAGRE